MRNYKTIDDIYPLTLIQMRYGDKYVAFNCVEDSDYVQSVNTEEVSYQLDEWLDEHVAPCVYGVGTSVYTALDDLLHNMNKKN